MAIAGRVAIVPKGDWSADATYKRLDAVTHNNTLYFAKKNVPAGTETSNAEYWSKSIVGSAVIVDDALSPTSTNPVQNKVVTSNLTDLKYGEVAGGKNLLNPNKTIIGELVAGEVTSGENYISDYIPIKSETSYSISNCTQGSNEVAWYTSDKTYISRSFTTPVISPSNASYVRIEYMDNINAQLEEGSVATDYEPYIPSVKVLAEENANQSTEMMDIKMLGWAVPRECPIQNEVNGNQFIQKVGRVDLGSLNWNLREDGSFENELFTSLPVGTTPDESKEYAIYSNLYKSSSWDVVVNSNTQDMVITLYKFYTWPYASISIRNKKYTDVDSFKQSMQGQYLYYELATPITKTIDGNEIGETVSDVIKETTVNLLKHTLQTTTENGVTCTNNGDGTYTLNGTATTNTWFTLGKAKLYSGKTYRLCGLNKVGNSTLYIQLRNDNIITQTTNDGINVNITETSENYFVVAFLPGNTAYNNVIYKPMITTNLNATYDDFVPYTGDTGKLNGDVAELNKTVDTLKKSVSDGKTKVANAITGKGVETATDATFDVMAKNISKIDTELHGATLAVSTSDNELFGDTVTLTLNGANVGTTVFASNGTCSFVVQKPGTYTVTCGEAHKDATVTNDNVLNKTVISVNLSLLKIVTFADGTDAEIAKMIQAHYNNKINIADYWAVGDTRTVSLSAMAATGVGESHRAQTVQFVIGDFNHDDLATPINGHSKAAVTLLQKDCLMDASNASNPVNGSGNTENGYMNSSDTNAGGWKNCARRTWCNNVFFSALPSAWQSMVKAVNKKSGTGGGSSSGTEITADKIFLAAEIEIFGSATYSFAGEGTQYQYYKNATANRYKMPKWGSSYVSHIYWERSPGSYRTSNFCIVDTSGSANANSANNANGVAPCLCI